MNSLSSAIAKEEVEYPTILNQNPTIVLSEDLSFKTKELKVAIEKEYPFLSKKGHQIVTFAGKADQPPRKVKIGVSFNGRQSPAGHNVIYGLLAENTEVIGFIGGNKGIF